MSGGRKFAKVFLKTTKQAYNNSPLSYTTPSQSQQPQRQGKTIVSRRPYKQQNNNSEDKQKHKYNADNANNDSIKKHRKDNNDSDGASKSIGESDLNQPPPSTSRLLSNIKPQYNADNEDITIYNIKNPLIENSSSACYLTAGFKIMEITNGTPKKKVLFSKKLDQIYASAGGVEEYKSDDGVSHKTIKVKSDKDHAKKSIGRNHAENSFMQNQANNSEPILEISPDSPLRQYYSQVFDEVSKDKTAEQIKSMKLRHKYYIKIDKYTPCTLMQDGKGITCHEYIYDFNNKLPYNLATAFTDNIWPKEELNDKQEAFVNVLRNLEVRTKVVNYPYTALTGTTQSEVTRFSSNNNTKYAKKKNTEKDLLWKADAEYLF